MNRSQNQKQTKKEEQRLNTAVMAEFSSSCRAETTKQRLTNGGNSRKEFKKTPKSTNKRSLSKILNSNRIKKQPVSQVHGADWLFSLQLQANNFFTL